MNRFNIIFRLRLCIVSLVKMYCTYRHFFHFLVLQKPDISHNLSLSSFCSKAKKNKGREKTNFYLFLIRNNKTRSHFITLSRFSWTHFVVFWCGPFSVFQRFQIVLLKRPQAHKVILWSQAFVIFLLFVDWSLLFIIF